MSAPADHTHLTEQEREIEVACEVMHNAYERAAKSEGWETQERSRKPWSDVPEANKATMRAAVSALLFHLSARPAPGPDAATALREAESEAVLRYPKDDDASRELQVVDQILRDGFRAGTAWAVSRLAAASPAPDPATEDTETRIAELQDAIEAMHEQQRLGVADGRANESLTMLQHWSATRGWLASRVRALRRGDEPNWPDAMNSEDEPVRCPCGHLAWVDHSGTPMDWNESPPRGCDNCTCERTEEEAEEAGRDDLDPAPRDGSGDPDSGEGDVEGWLLDVKYGDQGTRQGDPT